MEKLENMESNLFTKLMKYIADSNDPELNSMLHIAISKYKQKVIDSIVSKHYRLPFEVSPKADKIKYTYFITISFLEKTTPDDTKDAENVMINKKYMSKCDIYHEQRGDSLDTMGIGYHIHCIVHALSTKSKQHLIRETASTFKKFIDGDNYVNVKTIKTTQDLENIQNYVSGYKIDKEKLKKVEIDKIFKQKYNVR